MYSCFYHCLITVVFSPDHPYKVLNIQCESISRCVSVIFAYKYVPDFVFICWINQSIIATIQLEA